MSQLGGDGVTEPERGSDGSGENWGEGIVFAGVGGCGTGSGIEVEVTEKISHIKQQRDTAVSGDGKGLRETNGERELVGGEVEGEPALARRGGGVGVVAFDREENVTAGPVPVQAIGDGIERMPGRPEAGVGMVGLGCDAHAEIHAGVVSDRHAVKGDVVARGVCGVEETVLAGELHTSAVGADEFDLRDKP